MPDELGNGVHPTEIETRDLPIIDLGNYLDSAGSVTIVKVGYLGGYKVTGINLVVSGGLSYKRVAATFLPVITWKIK